MHFLTWTGHSLTSRRNSLCTTQTIKFFCATVARYLCSSLPTETITDISCHIVPFVHSPPPVCSGGCFHGFLYIRLFLIQNSSITLKSRSSFFGGGFFVLFLRDSSTACRLRYFQTPPCIVPVLLGFVITHYHVATG